MRGCISLEVIPQAYFDTQGVLHNKSGDPCFQYLTFNDFFYFQLNNLRIFEFIQALKQSCKNQVQFFERWNNQILYSGLVELIKHTKYTDLSSIFGILNSSLPPVNVLERYLGIISKTQMQYTVHQIGSYTPKFIITLDIKELKAEKIIEKLKENDTKQDESIQKQPTSLYFYRQSFVDPILSCMYDSACRHQISLVGFNTIPNVPRSHQFGFSDFENAVSKELRLACFEENFDVPLKVKALANNFSMRLTTYLLNCRLKFKEFSRSEFIAKRGDLGFYVDKKGDRPTNPTKNLSFFNLFYLIYLNDEPDQNRAWWFIGKNSQETLLSQELSSVLALSKLYGELREKNYEKIHAEITKDKGQYYFYLNLIADDLKFGKPNLNEEIAAGNMCCLMHFNQMDDMKTAYDTESMAVILKSEFIEDKLYPTYKMLLVGKLRNPSLANACFNYFVDYQYNSGIVKHIYVLNTQLIHQNNQNAWPMLFDLTQRFFKEEQSLLSPQENCKTYMEKIDALKIRFFNNTKNLIVDSADDISSDAVSSSSSLGATTTTTIANIPTTTKGAIPSVFHLSSSSTAQNQTGLTCFQQVETTSKAVQGEVNEKDLTNLLKWVTEGHLEEVEKLLKKNPTLGLGIGTVVDRSNRTFKNITGLEYAAWALDTEMAELIISYLGAHHSAMQLKALVEEPECYNQHGTHYDMMPLVTKTKTYIDNYATWDYEKRCQYWQKAVGEEQRKCPAWLIYAWSEEGYDVAWTKQDPNRKINREYEKHRLDWWFTENWNNGKGVGTTWAAVRGKESSDVGWRGRQTIEPAAGDYDQKCISVFVTTRRQTLQRLRDSVESQLKQNTLSAPSSAELQNQNIQPQALSQMPLLSTRNVPMVNAQGFTKEKVMVEDIPEEAALDILDKMEHVYPGATYLVAGAIGFVAGVTFFGIFKQGANSAMQQTFSTTPTQSLQ